MPLALHSSNLGATGGGSISYGVCAIGCHVDEALDGMTRRICIVTILMRVQISICGFSGDVCRPKSFCIPRSRSRMCRGNIFSSGNIWNRIFDTMVPMH